MSFLYHAVYALEAAIAGFNAKAYNVDHLIALAGSLGFLFLEDNSVKHAVSFKYKNRHICYYNPHKEQNELLLVLGHELGHYLLNHFDSAPLYHSPEGLFSKKGIEKDASIVGFLMWYPTPRLDYTLNLYQTLDAEILYNELNNCDSDCKLYDYCKARLRIYRAYTHISRLNYL